VENAVDNVNALLANLVQALHIKETARGVIMVSDKKIPMTVDTTKKPTVAGDLAALGGRKLVYIRAVAAIDVIDDLGDEFGDHEIGLDADTVLYSVHASDGERIALVGDRDLAFAAARQYEMNPVSVH